MNKLFSPRHKYRNGILQGLSSIAAAVLFIVVLVLIGIRLAAPAFWYRLSTPVWQLGAVLGMQTNSLTTQSKASLRVELDASEQKVVELTVQNAALAARAADMTQLLGTRKDPAPGIVARVLARPPVAPYDVLIIDQGTADGIKLGALVAGNGGTPVGTVGQADAVQSRVTLYSTHGIESNGWVGASHIPLTLTGEGAGAFRASVPKEAGVQVGDGVYLANASSVPVGTVAKIEIDPSSPMVNLDVHPYANPFSLVWVTVSRY